MREQLGVAPANDPDAATKNYVDDPGTIDPTTGYATYVAKMQLPVNAALQSFAIDSATGDIYAAQANGTAPGGDTLLFRMTGDGTIIDHQTLSGGGHLSQMALERVGSTVYIWGFWYTPVSGSAFPFRWAWSGQSYSTSPILSTDATVHQMPNLDGGAWQEFCIDQPADLITIRYVAVAGETNCLYVLRHLSELEAGTNNVLQSLSVPNVDATYGSPQGQVGDLDYLYAAFGGGTLGTDMPPILVRFDWATGTPTTVQLSELNLEGGATGTYLEAEGISIYYPTARQRAILVGMATSHDLYWEAWLYAFARAPEPYTWAARTYQAPPFFCAYQGTAQTIAKDTWTPISFDSMQVDTRFSWKGSPNYYYVAPIAGWYQVSVTVCYASAASGKLIAGVQVNGAAAPHQLQSVGEATGTQLTVQLVGAMVYLNAGDTCGFSTYQTTSGSQATSAGYSACSILWVHA